MTQLIEFYEEVAALHKKYFPEFVYFSVQMEIDSQENNRKIYYKIKSDVCKFKTTSPYKTTALAQLGSNLKEAKAKGRKVYNSDSKF